MEKKYKCSICGKTYSQEWAKENHEKLCRERKWYDYRLKDLKQSLLVIFLFVSVITLFRLDLRVAGVVLILIGIYNSVLENYAKSRERNSRQSIHIHSLE